MALMNNLQTREKAEILALEALTWLAGDEESLQRFLDQSGTDASILRATAGSPGTQVAVLDFLLANEDLLLRFCENAAIEPRFLHLAHHQLGGAA
jgi:hypothetical protein